MRRSMREALVWAATDWSTDHLQPSHLSSLFFSCLLIYFSFIFTIYPLLIFFSQIQMFLCFLSCLFVYNLHFFPIHSRCNECMHDRACLKQVVGGCVFSRTRIRPWDTHSILIRVCNICIYSKTHIHKADGGPSSKGYATSRRGDFLFLLW